MLHHPHTADSKLTWRLAWASLERELHCVKLYAGAGRHWHRDGPRSPLDETLSLTKRGRTIDFIVDAGTIVPLPGTQQRSGDDARPESHGGG